MLVSERRGSIERYQQEVSAGIGTNRKVCVGIGKFQEVSAGISWYGHSWGTIGWYWKAGIEKAKSKEH